MTPQFVADNFVKQYYTILTMCPGNLHKFYQDSSLLGWPGDDDVVTLVTTLPGINDKIMSSVYKNCSLEIKTVDAQGTPVGGIILAVAGISTAKDDVKRNFSQTFFLAKQGIGFYVSNDLLRLFDLCERTAKAAESDDSVNGLPAPSLETLVSRNVSDRPKSSDSKVVDENEKTEDSVNLSASRKIAANGADYTSSAASRARPNSVVSPASNVKEEPKKVTYASMVAKAAPVASPGTVRVTSVAPPTTKASVHLSDGAAIVANPSYVASRSPAPLSEAMPKSGTASDVAARRIFIGGLPYNITNQEIVDVMKKFGPVRGNANTVQIRRRGDGFNWAFLEFESADSATRAVEARRVKFGGRKARVTYWGST